jgi:hypothetical protein
MNNAFNSVLMKMYQNHLLEFTISNFRDLPISANVEGILESLFNQGYLHRREYNNGFNSYYGYSIKPEVVAQIDKLEGIDKANPYSYFQRVKERLENEAAEEKALDLEKKRYEVKNAKRVFKTYWLTFSLAVIGSIVSVVLLILKFFGK